MLTICHECHREVSTEAIACPHCGCPLKSQGGTKILALAIGVALIIVALVFFLVTR